MISDALAPGATDATAPAVELREGYRRYRTRQARRLASMLPPAAVRPLYRRAFAAASRRVEGASSSLTDPMELLVAFCEELLPLPPFERWLEDVTLYPEAHLLELDDSADVPTAQSPATVETRSLTFRDESWFARLRTFRDGPIWRGFISFEERRSGRLHRTALIFREDDPAALRDRFLGFEREALRAFLRSALP